MSQESEHPRDPATGLPIPQDDGAADGLPGRALPALALPSTSGGLIDLADYAREARTLVLYIYPRTGTPGVALPEGWDEIPGARGCTTQSCSFRDHEAELRELGASVVGLSAQTPAEQAEFAARERIPYPLLSDPDLRLADMLGLPTFTAAGMTLYRRITLIVRDETIARVFYPVFPPDRNAAEVAAWLSAPPASARL